MRRIDDVTVAVPPLSRLRTLLPVALVSSSVLGYEILLARLFAIIQWHHFAYMVISIALLGFGASGTFLCFAGRALQRRYEFAFAANSMLFAVTCVASFLLAQGVELNVLELAWSLGQAGRLLVIYLALMVPFFFAANAIGLALMAYSSAAARVYGWDLVGASLGAAGIVGLLFLVSPEYALLMVALPAAGAALMVVARRPVAGLAAFLLIAAGLILLFQSAPSLPFRLHMSQYKALSQALEITGARLTVSRDSPLARLSVVENSEIPLRHAPGFSLLAAAPIPAQAALFIDGDGPLAITRYDGMRDSVAFVDYVPSALPYHFLRTPDVLIVGLGGGAGVLQAHYHGAPNIDVVELNPQVVDIIKNDYGAFAGNILDGENVRVIIDEARGFVEKAGRRYDLIQMSAPGSLVASGSGLKALSASHLLTVEGVGTLIALLEPGGFLSISGWLKLPPRDSVKLFATAVYALRSAGFGRPGRSLAWIRSFNTYTLVVKNGAFSASEASTLRSFASARGFDVAFYSGMRDVEANRFNQLEVPYFYNSARALLSDKHNEFISGYKFDIRPATDDRPYFFKFFKPTHAAEILALRSYGGMGLLDLGYLLVWATLVQALLLSVVLILSPLVLFLRRGESMKESVASTAAALLYFICLGAGFIFIEVTFIEKFMLVLNHPVYAVAVVLAGFLLFAGLGALVAMRGAGRPVRWRILLPIAAVIVTGALNLELLAETSDTLVMLSDTLRVLFCLLITAPLAFFMGMPFPVAIEALSDRRPGLVPWAWGANGCASVVGAVLAVLGASSYGGSLAIALGLAMYFAAGAAGVYAFAARTRTPARAI